MPSKYAKSKVLKCRTEIDGVPLSLTSLVGRGYDCLIMDKNTAVAEFKKPRPTPPRNLALSESLFAIVCFNYQYGSTPEKPLRERLSDAFDWLWGNRNKQGWDWIIKPLLTNAEMEQLSADTGYVPTKFFDTPQQDWVRENTSKEELKNRYKMQRGQRGMENQPAIWRDIETQLTDTLFPNGPEAMVYTGQLNIIFALPARGRLEFAGISIIGDPEGKHWLETALKKHFQNFYRGCVSQMLGDIQRNLKSCVSERPDEASLRDAFPEIFARTASTYNVVERYNKKMSGITKSASVRSGK